MVRLNMTEGDGESVGGVAGFGQLGEGEQGTNHELYLAFVGVTVTCDRSFYFTRRVAVYGDTVLRGREKNNAADFGEAQCGTYVQRGENRLNGHDCGCEFLDQTAEQCVNVLKSGAREFLLALCCDAKRAVVNHRVAAAVAFNDAVAGRPCGGGIHA